jgi:hypothetical protein
MHRRDFILSGVKVSLSFLAWDALSSPIFGQGREAGASARPSLGQIDLTNPPDSFSDSLNVIAAYLVQYRPPTENFPANGAWKATYDVIEWKGSPSGEGAKFSRQNRVIGRLAMTRRPQAGGDSGPNSAMGVGYDLDHAITINGFESTLKSTMTCSGGRLPGLLDWKTDYEMHPIKQGLSPLTLSERGRHQDGVLEITSLAGTRRIPTDRLVASQWAVLDALRGARADPVATEVEFDLLQDLTSYRPHQVLKPCGVLEISLDGKSHRLHGFVQTGWGMQPTHTWIDAAGRPLLVTGGLLANALISIREA